MLSPVALPLSSSPCGSTARSPLHILAVACFAAAACAGTSDRSQAELEPVPDTPQTLEIELGTGIDTFEPLVAADSPVALTYGPQGGFHIWTSVRTSDTTIEKAQINVSSRFAEDGSPAGPASRWPAALVLRGGARDHTGMRNFIGQVAMVKGQRIILRAELIAADGRHGAAERIVVPYTTK